MSCVTCGNRSDSDLCERCMEDMYAQEYQRQAEQEAYESEGQLSIDEVLSAASIEAVGRVIPSRTTDPETSHAAAREIRVKANSQRALLLAAFYDAWRFEVGFTDEDAMRYSRGVRPESEYSKRCSELREGGFIEATGETRAGSAGPQRIVSRITPKGRAWIEANR